MAHARSPRATSCSRSAGTHGGAAAWHWRREPPRHRRQASPVAADAGALRRGFLLPLRVCSCPRRNPSCLCSTTAPVRVASSSPEATAAAQLGGAVRRYVVLFSSSLSWLLLGSLERSGPGRGRRPRMHVAALGVRCIGAARTSVPRCHRRAMSAVGAGRPPLARCPCGSAFDPLVCSLCLSLTLSLSPSLLCAVNLPCEVAMLYDLDAIQQVKVNLTLHLLFSHFSLTNLHGYCLTADFFGTAYHVICSVRLDLEPT